jgi:hypothetical protein
MKLPVALALALALLLAGAPAAPSTVVARSVMANGGTRSLGAVYAASCTAGQPAVGLLAGSSYVFGAGFWYQTWAAYAGIQQPDDPVPSRFWLSQNYPNPFGQITNIRFAVPRPSHVSILIYDVRGRQVLTLADGDMAPGYYTRALAGEALSNGVYFCQIRADRFVMTRKITLVR